MTGIFVILLSQGVFESNWLEIKFQTITSSSQFEKVTVQNAIGELVTVISNKMMKYQLPHTRFNQINDHKHDIYLYGKLSTKLLVQTTNKNTKFMFTKNGRLCFFWVCFYKWLSGKILNKHFRTKLDYDLDIQDGFWLRSWFIDK